MFVQKCKFSFIQAGRRFVVQSVLFKMAGYKLGSVPLNFCHRVLFTFLLTAEYGMQEMCFTDKQIYHTVFS